MYNVSNEYKKAIDKLSRETKIKGVITLTDGTEVLIEDKDIMLGTLNIDNACVSGQDFELGSVYMGQLKMSINTSIDRYKLYGAIVTISYFLKLENGDFEEVPLGIYTVDEAMRNGKYISLTAYDNMSAFDRDFIDTTNGTAFDLLTFSCNTCGITLGQSESEINDMSPKFDNEPIIFRITDGTAYSTFRDIISDIAITLGGFATINRKGELVIKRFSSENISLNEKHRKKTSISDYVVKYTSVKLTIDDAVYTSGTENGRKLSLQSELWNTGTVEVKQAIADHLASIITGIEYTPTDVDFDGDPSIDLGDKIEYTGGSVEEKVTSYVMTSNWTYRNSHKVKALGSNPLIATAKSKTDKQISKTEGTVKQNELKISTFQSASIFEISNFDQLIIQMGINATSGAMIFQGQCIIEVEKAGTFEIVYELNGNQFLFKPRQIVTYAGYYLINLYYPITTLSPDYTNNFNVYMKSIDGGVGTIDTGSIVANLIGSNLGAGKNPFTGIIDLTGKFTMTKFAGFEKVKFKEQAKVECFKPSLQSFNETYKMVGFSGIDIFNMSDNFDIENDDASRYIREKYHMVGFGGMGVPMMNTGINIDITEE